MKSEKGRDEEETCSERAKPQRCYMSGAMVKAGAGRLEEIGRAHV